MSSAEETGKNLQSIALKKLSYSWQKSFVLSILGGSFISLGAIFYILVGTGGGLPFGLARLLAGLVFSLGLILVIISGAELFTGSTIVSVAVANKKANLWQLLVNWTRVYLGNFVGAILIVLLVIFSRHYYFGDGVVGILMVNTAVAKLHHSFLEAVCLGILCNILVCLAIWLTYNAKSVSAKIISLIFPITAFVAAGFEHSVANMYFVPAVLLIKVFDVDFVSKFNTADLTLGGFLVNNLLPVTIGNIIGGVVVWLTFNWLYKKHA